MSVLNNPPVLLLDEPTSGLDPRFTRLLKDWILSFRENGTTIIISTHITAVAEDICDRVAIIHKGRIRAMGEVGALPQSTGAATLEDAFVQVIDSIEHMENENGEAEDTWNERDFAVPHSNTNGSSDP